MENDEQISKKDLLEITNISYGQLYRWKRKGLIPEEWFIRKSSYTGQETFFPRNRVLSRIEKIKNMKEDISLDDLADVFSPVQDELHLSPEDIVKRNIVSHDVMKMYQNYHGNTDVLDFNAIRSAYILNKLIAAGDIGLEEGKSLLEVLQEGMILFGGEPSEVFLVRKLGIFSCFAVSPPGRICMDKGARMIGRINTAAITEELKLKMI